MPGNLILIDTNVLIRWVQPEGSEFQLVQRAIPRFTITDDTSACTSQNLGEFWNVLTRPSDRNGYGLTPEAVLRRAEIVESRFRLLPDSPTIHYDWRRLLVDHRIRGLQVHDLRLVASMLVHKVKHIVPFNTRDFARFPTVEAIHPLDLSKAGS